MALYDSVDGVYRKVSKKYDPVDGVYRKVKKAYDPVDGVARQYFSGGLTANALAVGDSIWLSEGGTLQEFLVIHKGRPSTLYDASCDGVWLTEKYYTYGNRRTSYEAESSNIEQGYHGCRPHVWLNSISFYDRLDSKAQAAIKQVKIPYQLCATPAGDETWTLKSGANGLSTKVFLLSAYELGWTSATDSRMKQDGACLDYFKGTAVTDAKRILTYTPEEGSTARIWWTRSFLSQYFITAVSSSGSWSRVHYSSANYFRAAFIIDSNTPIDNTTGKNILA